MDIKKATLIVWLACLLVAGIAFAHHAAEGIIDAEIYQMIDAMVADTPHAALDFTDLGGGLTTISVETRTATAMENLLEDGLLTYASMLDGEVRIEIDFAENGAVLLTIYQQE